MISDKAFDVLRTTSLFAGFTDEQLEMVPKVGRERNFEQGQTIVAEGDTDIRSLWLVLDGEVDVVVSGEALRTMGAGTHFGEMALLTGAPRSADIVARTSVVALELTQNHLNGLIGANPQVALDMLAVLATRLNKATEALAAVMASSEEAAAAAREFGVGQVEGSVSPHFGAIESQPSGAELPPG